MLLDPGVRGRFFATGTHQLVFKIFLAPDTVIFAGGSLLTAALILFRSRFARASTWVVVGATLYAAVGAIAANWPIGRVPIADGLMILVLLNSFVCAVMVNRSAHEGK